MDPKPKILIADDNEDLCRNLADILEFKGYDVTAVFDGYQAIEAFKKNKFHVVLMDVKMPGLSGIDTLKVLRQISADVRVIMITAFADDMFYKDGLKNGDYQVIQKPIDIDKFLVTLEELVRKKHVDKITPG